MCVADLDCCSQFFTLSLCRIPWQCPGRGRVNWPAPLTEVLVMWLSLSSGRLADPMVCRFQACLPGLTNPLTLLYHHEKNMLQEVWPFSLVPKQKMDSSTQSEAWRQVCPTCGVKQGSWGWHTVSHPVTWGSSLQLWLRKRSASFQWVFCESCSTWRCISDVFVGRKWAPRPPTLPSWPTSMRFLNFCLIGSYSRFCP